MQNEALEAELWELDQLNLVFKTELHWASWWHTTPTREGPSKFLKWQFSLFSLSYQFEFIGLPSCRQRAGLIVMVHISWTHAHGQEVGPQHPLGILGLSGATLHVLTLSSNGSPFQSPHRQYLPLKRVPCHIPSPCENPSVSTGSLCSVECYFLCSQS